MAISGFGRIGRQSLRALLERAPELEIAAVNSTASAEMSAHLFKHDSTYGAYAGSVALSGDKLVIDGRQIALLSERDPAALPWSKAAQQWRERVMFLRSAEGEPWPDLSDAHLAETLPDWLGPHLSGLTRLEPPCRRHQIRPRQQATPERVQHKPKLLF